MRNYYHGKKNDRTRILRRILQLNFTGKRPGKHQETGNCCEEEKRKDYGQKE
jgi:hypothetical protein